MRFPAALGVAGALLASCNDRIGITDAGREPVATVEARLAGQRDPVIARGIARLVPTEGNAVRGTVLVRERPDGLAVEATAASWPGPG